LACTFPTHVVNPATIRARVLGRTLSSGENLLGDEDVIEISGGGRWRVDFEGIELIGRQVGQFDYSDADMARLWSTWEAHAAAGTVAIDVPVPFLDTAPRPVAGGRPLWPGDLVHGSPDPYFPEATGFAAPLIVARIIDPAALRATQLHIHVSRGSQPRGGEHFSIVHPTKGPRLYKVERVVAPPDQPVTVRISPPLREAVADDTPLDFDWPRLRARLVPNSDISAAFTWGRADSLSISFVEAP